MTSLLALWNPTYPLRFMSIYYGFLFKLRVLNLNKKGILPIIAQYIYDGEDIGHPYYTSNRKILNRNGVKRKKGDKIRMGL